MERHETGSVSRRQMLGCITSGLVAVAAPALAQQGSDSEERSRMPATPPTRKSHSPYPKPPFPAQYQEPPGLAGKMMPRPDHGETTYQGNRRLEGRKALVTGGDSGIGRAAVIAFAREGADVAINYLPAEEPDAREVVQLIREAGQKAVALPGDIRDERFCKKLVDEAVRELGGLDILVNNAARQQAAASILDLTTESFDATFKTNVYAMFWITKAALPYLKSGACIINTASAQAYEPSAHLLDYAQTKSAIVSFSKSLAQQLGPMGIRVNAVAPGPVWTPLEVSGGLLDGMVETFGQDKPIGGRPGQPAELASLYVLLASEEPGYTSGQVFGATGGTGGP
jgi:NAD(P)-dependent dehydrogenase (short-subunit alcohol dehydrogenase family)